MTLGPPIEVRTGPDASLPAGSAPLVLVAGATGYIGGHLVGPLERAGYRVRAMARSPQHLRGIASPSTEVARADVFDAGQVRAAMRDVDTAVYLVHSMGESRDFAVRDRKAAGIFAGAAREAGVRRIVFMGALGADEGPASEHLSSRHEVGRLLASAGVPVVELRASIALGSGSTPFEMIRNLVEKLPVILTPRWAHSPSQPISIEDLVDYLVSAVALPDALERTHRIYEVGGAEVITYLDLLRLYAQRRGLKRLIVSTPLLPLRLSAWGLSFLAPKQAAVGRQLARSLRQPTVVTTGDALRDFPDIRPVGALEAFDGALAAERESLLRMRWSDEFADRPVGVPAIVEYEGRYVDSRAVFVACPPEVAFGPVARIGGEKGWYAFEPLWDVRGFLDFLLGGPGRRRRRRDDHELIKGDVLEWWRVTSVDPPLLLQLEAELVMPGSGWLQYELTDHGRATMVRQTAIFDPKGVLGRLYWYAVVPFHHLVFNGTLKGIERECPVISDGLDGGSPVDT